jgi:hypothetical protein
MPTPPFAPTDILTTNAVLLDELRHNTIGEIISKIVSTGTLEEMLPCFSVAIARSPAVTQPLDLLNRVNNELL